MKNLNDAIENGQTKISHYFDIREFVSRATWEKHCIKSFWLVQQRIINTCKLLHLEVSKEYDVPQTDVSVRINNWHFEEDGNKIYEHEGYISGGHYVQKLEEQGLHQDDFDSFHRQGHAVNVRVNIKRDGEIKHLTSYEIAVIILKYEDDFILNGLTVIGEPRKTKYRLHLDCRNTRSFKLKIF